MKYNLTSSTHALRRVLSSDAEAINSQVLGLHAISLIPRECPDNVIQGLIRFISFDEDLLPTAVVSGLGNDVLGNESDDSCWLLAPALVRFVP